MGKLEAERDSSFLAFTAHVLCICLEGEDLGNLIVVLCSFEVVVISFYQRCRYQQDAMSLSQAAAVYQS